MAIWPKQFCRCVPFRQVIRRKWANGASSQPFSKSHAATSMLYTSHVGSLSKCTIVAWSPLWHAIRSWQQYSLCLANTSHGNYHSELWVMAPCMCRLATGGTSASTGICSAILTTKSTPCSSTLRTGARMRTATATSSQPSSNRSHRWDILASQFCTSPPDAVAHL